MKQWVITEELIEQCEELVRLVRAAVVTEASPGVETLDTKKMRCLDIAELASNIEDAAFNELMLWQEVSCLIQEQ